MKEECRAGNSDWIPPNWELSTSLFDSITILTLTLLHTGPEGTFTEDSERPS